MAEAVHVHERITSQVSESGLSFVTKMTISASELTTAGFAANDDVIIFAWVMVATASGSTHPIWQVTYNGAGLHVGAPYRYDLATTIREKGTLAMFRVDLGGTVADIDLDLASGTDTVSVFIEKAEIVVIRYSDFGVDNTDVFWNESTTDYAHTTTFSPTDQASVTFTPGAVEDWIVIGSIETQVDSATVNHEYRINLDSGTFLGSESGTNVPSEEGEDTAESKSATMIDRVNLSTSEHTIENEVQDDATGANNNRRSALLIFRAGVWADLFIHENGDVSIADDTDVQVATITDTLSTAQDVVMFGHGLPAETSTALNSQGWMWIREGGSTVIDPVIDQSSGLNLTHGFDNTDQNLNSVLAFRNLSGTLDLDLFHHQTDDSTRTLHKSTLLVWGMELAGAPPGGAGKIIIQNA